MYAVVLYCLYMMSYMTDSTIAILVGLVLMLFSRRILNLSLSVLSMVTSLAVAVFSVVIAAVILVITAIPLGAGTCIVAKSLSNDGKFQTQFLQNFCGRKPQGDKQPEVRDYEYRKY
jgi:hypothetical protein